MKTQSPLGKTAAWAVATWWLWRPTVADVRDAQDSVEWRARGVDFAVTRKRGRPYGLEVKVDFWKTKNIALETVSVSTTGKPGCWLTSQADVWAYWRSGHDQLFILPVAEVRPWFLERVDSFRLAEVPNQGYHSECRLVPADLVAAVPGVEVVEGFWRDYCERVMGRYWRN